ncbi:hypothetical protein LIT25_25435 [Bacillus sp. F19]|nr:hypothetical protein LIT25_25435 [Bacillus sp. F19]
MSPSDFVNLAVISNHHHHPGFHRIIQNFCEKADRQAPAAFHEEKYMQEDEDGQGDDKNKNKNSKI